VGDAFARAQQDIKSRGVFIVEVWRAPAKMMPGQRAKSLGPTYYHRILVTILDSSPTLVLWFGSTTRY